MVSMPSKLSEHHILHITMSSMANHSNFPKLPFLITIMHMQPHWSRSIKIFHELKNKICKWQYYAWHTKLEKKTFIDFHWGMHICDNFNFTPTPPLDPLRSGILLYPFLPLSNLHVSYRTTWPKVSMEIKLMLKMCMASGCIQSQINASLKE